MLIDTNIFLEILLEQNNIDNCKKFLIKNIGNLHLSDFSLHSIGVILFRNRKEDVFLNFINDILPQVELLSLTKSDYEMVIQKSNNFKLDFDDSYQCAIADKYELGIVTMDKDFKKVEKEFQVIFL